MYVSDSRVQVIVEEARGVLIRQAHKGEYAIGAHCMLDALQFIGAIDPADYMGWINEAGFVARRYHDRKTEGLCK